MTNDVLKTVKDKDRKRLLNLERKFRQSGQWGPWETLHFLPGSCGGGGWASEFTTAHRNRVFSVLDRMTGPGIRHLAVSSLSGIRPTWWEMQRIKDDLAGADATAIEVYPPRQGPAGRRRPVPGSGRMTIFPPRPPSFTCAICGEFRDWSPAGRSRME